MSEGKESPLVSSNVVEPVRGGAAHKEAENARVASDTTHATLNPALPTSHQSLYGSTHPLPAQSETTAGGYTSFPEVENFFGSLDARNSGQTAVSMPPHSTTLMTYEDSITNLANAQSGYGTTAAKGTQYYPTSAADFYKSGNMFSASSTTPLLSHHYSVTPNRCV